MVSCAAKKQQGKYYLKDQWITRSADYFPVKNKPHSIREYLFKCKTEADTLPKPLDQADSYEDYVYDSAGNRLEYNIVLGNGSVYRYITTYIESGYTTMLTITSSGITSKQKAFEFMPAGDGRYKLIKDSVNGYEQFYTYFNNGNEVLIEKNFDFGVMKSHTLERTFYDGQRILKKVSDVKSTNGNFTNTTEFKYTGNNVLKGMQDQLMGGSIKDYTLNAAGDPTKEVVIRNHKDTMIYKTYSYLYDAKGNWIRRLEKDNLSQKYYQPGRSYALLIREITY